MLQSLPKVELHLHIDGAVRHETLLDVLTKMKLPLPGDGSICAMKKEMIISTPGASLDSFLHKFSIIYSALVGNLDVIERIAYELCEDQAKNGVIYFEGRISPHILCTSIETIFNAKQRCNGLTSVTPSMIVESTLAGFKRGEKDFNIKARTILCCIRGFPEWSKEILDLCIKFKDQGVVGIDIAGNEGKNVQESWDIVNDKSVLQENDLLTFQRAKELGIHRTVHACEVGPSQVARVAWKDMHAERIGHGYHIIKDDSLFQEICEARIHLEACPKSSICTGLEYSHGVHPIISYATNKANYSINTDDPVLTGSYLAKEFEFAKDLGLTDDDLIEAVYNAAKSAFISEEEKEELIAILNKAYRPTL